MKLLLSLIAASLICITASAIQVTFQVDMSEQTLSPDGVHLAGSFGADGYAEWDPASIALSDQGLGLWSVTLSLTEGVNYEYKYINGNSWGLDEGAIESPCGVNNNRSWTVGAIDESIPLHCYASCLVCPGPPPTHQITFQVEMSLQVVDPSGVFLAGTFNGFSESATPMINQGGNIWSVTIGLEEAQSYEYKFLNGPSFTNEEQVPLACGVDNGFGGFNRSFTVGTNDETVPLVCFSTCAPCTFVNYNITFQVDMSNEVVDPNGIHLMGTFNGFDPASISMTDMGGGLWETVVAIQSGQIIEYAFVNGNTTLGQEVIDPACANGSGYREYFVFATEATLGPDCFGFCGTCAINMVNVTFQVDMSNEVIDAAGVHIAGSFQGWDPATSQMTDQGSGIWTFELEIASGTNLEYKFVNGNTWGLDETVPFACNVAGNREWVVGTVDEPIPLVCFGSCVICAAPTHNVTFSVDMSLQNVDPAGVHLVGSFDSAGYPAWDPAGILMNDMGAGIWSVDLILNEAEGYEYKYVNGVDFSADEGFINAPCGTGGGNRSWLVGATDESIPLHCFSLCDACPAPVNVTFNVDMSYQVVDAAGVYLAGDFNDWDASATPMTDLGNGIWQVTILLNPLSSFEFKYVNGNDLVTQAELIPFECQSNGNRYLSTDIADFELSPVCFGECVGCFIDVTFRVDMWNETVPAAGVHLSGSFQGWDPASTPMTYLGYGIWSVSIQLERFSYYEWKFLNGNSFGDDEDVPLACAENWNRNMVTGGNSFVLDLVCFRSCTLCDGCTDPFSLEFNPFAELDNGTCATPVVWGCIYEDATNYNLSANVDNDTCLFDFNGNCPQDVNNDGIINTGDLNSILGSYGQTCD